MPTNKLILPLIICLSAICTLSAQTNFDRLIQSLEAVKADPAANAEAIVVENIESLNTRYLEYAPTLHKNGLVFSSNRPKKDNALGRFFSTLNSNVFYTAEEADNFFFKPIELPGKINTSRHEGAIAFYNDHNSMIYTTNCRKRNAEGIYDLKLSAAEFKEGKWKHTSDLPFSTEYRACHPTVSNDGLVLIFSALRPEGLGGMDLYISLFENGIWQKPQNMGPEVNSTEDEVFPTLTEEGILVFSSTGHNGCGGLDLFYAEPVSEFCWANPVNFGNPINSSKDDFGFMTMSEGTKGCFTSNRLGGKGKDDLYLWQINEIPTPADQLTTNILILDESTGIPLQETDISLIEINNNLLMTGQLQDEVIIANAINPAMLSVIGNELKAIATTEKGHKYAIQSDRNYFLMIKQEGYTPVQRIVGVQHLVEYDEYAIVMNSTDVDMLEGLALQEEEIIKTITTPALVTEELIIASVVIEEPIEEVNTEVKREEIIAPSTHTNDETEVFTSRGIPNELIKEELKSVTTHNTSKVYNLSNIYYEFNKFELSKESKMAIDEIIDILKNDTKSAITIKSHTDSRGAKSFNKQLSQKRAEAVKSYMKLHGIDDNRIIALGMGEEFLLNECESNVKCSEDLHKKNRRTEFIIDQQKLIINN